MRIILNLIGSYLELLEMEHSALQKSHMQHVVYNICRAPQTHKNVITNDFLYVIPHLVFNECRTFCKQDVS